MYVRVCVIYIWYIYVTYDNNDNDIGLEGSDLTSLATLKGVGRKAFELTVSRRRRSEFWILNIPEGGDITLYIW